VLRHRQPRNRQAAGLAAQQGDLTAAGAERIVPKDNADLHGPLARSFRQIVC
jgi:hypothetical protein